MVNIDLQQYLEKCFYSCFGGFMIQRYIITNFSYIERFGVAEIVYTSGLRSFAVFQFISSLQYVDNPVIHIVRLYNDRKCALAAYKALTI